MTRTTELEHLAQQCGYAFTYGMTLNGSLVDYVLEQGEIRLLVLVRDTGTTLDLEYLSSVGEKWERRMLYLLGGTPPADLYKVAKHLKITIACRPSEIPILAKPSASSQVTAEPTTDRSAFIIMSFGPSRPGFLPTVDICAAAKRACDRENISARRADDIEHTGSITKLVLDQIRASSVVIADLTYERPNVYYEIGFAHGIGKQVILTAQVGTLVHFDLADINCISFESVTELEERIVKRLKGSEIRYTSRSGSTV